MAEEIFITVELEGNSTNFRCSKDENLLKAMVRDGSRDIPVGCRNGGCGICKIVVLTGDYKSGKMSRTHLTHSDACKRIVLACKCIPISDLRIKPISRKLRKNISSAEQGT